MGEYENGMIYGELVVPNDVEAPPSAIPVRFTVEQSPGSTGSELVFSAGWIGAAGSAEYVRWLEDSLAVLQNRVVERCIAE